MYFQIMHRYFLTVTVSKIKLTSYVSLQVEQNMVFNFSQHFLQAHDIKDLDS